MGYLDDFKEFMFRKPISEPDSHPDSDYTKHSEEKRFQASPTGQAIRELERVQAQQDTFVSIEPRLTEPSQQGADVFMSNATTTKDSKGKTPPLDKKDYRRAPLPTGPIDLQTGEAPGQAPVLSFNDMERAKVEKEHGRQALLKQNLDATDKARPQTPPTLADTALNLLDYPGHVVRKAITDHIEETTGEKVDPEKLSEFVTGKMEAQGKTVSEGDKALFDLTSKVLTDPLTFLPVIGLPVDAYKAGGRAIKGAYEGMTDASKLVGVDLASERGSMFGKVLTPTEGQKWAFGKDETPTFYSPTARVLEAKMPNSASPAQVQGLLTNSGVPADEAKWMGLDEFLVGKEKVSKQEVLDYVNAHQFQLEEVQLTSDSGYTYQGNEWQTAITRAEAAGNFDEAERIQRAWEGLDESTGSTAGQPHYSNYKLPGGTNYREFLLKVPGAGYKAPHFGEQGEDILLHFRTSDREVVTESGPQRTLMVEEIQSDLHQNGRKRGYVAHHAPGIQRFSVRDDGNSNFAVVNQSGDIIIVAGSREYAAERAAEYNANGLPEHLQDGRARGYASPDLPFKKDWTELGIKRILRLAAEEGYDRVAWTTGEQQARLYDLSKQISRIELHDNTSGGVARPNMEGPFKGGNLIAYDHTHEEVINTYINDPSNLADHIGKEAAEKLLTTQPIEGRYAGLGVRSRKLEGLDLKVGGEGMKGFYDDILPKTVNKYVKKWGGKVEDVELPTTQATGGTGWDSTEFAKKNVTEKVHSLPITPQMAEAVLNNPQSLMGSVFQSLEDHFKTLPKMVQEELRKKLPTPKQFKKLSEEGGYVAFGPVWMITRAVLGSIAGAKVGDEENAIRNALIGAGVGALASPSLIRSLAQSVKALKGGGADANLGIAKAATQKTHLAPQTAPMATPISQFSAQYKQFVDEARRGVRHDVEVAADGDLLVTLGQIDETYIKNLYPGTALNVEQTYAIHKVLTQSGKRLLELSSTVTDDVSAQEFLKAFWAHGTLLDPKRLGVMAEAGRSERIYGVDAPVDMQAMKAFLNQFSNVMDQVKVGMSPLMVAEMVKSFKTPEQMAIFAKNAVKPGLKDAFLGLWINSLLSGPHTHVANAVSNGATLGWGIMERQFAPVFGGDVKPGEAAAMIHGVYESFTDALRTFWEVFKSGEDTGKIEMHHTPSFQEVGLTGVPGKALDYISAFFQGMGGRPLAASDAFFKAIAFRAEARARALREAYNVVNAEDLTGKAARERVKELYQQYMTDIPEDIAKDAEKFAAYVTFTQNLGPTGAWLQEGSAKFPVVKLVIPFVKAPINIFKYANERTPWGLFSKSFMADIKAGGARADLAMAKWSMGAMTMGSAALLAMDGIITGGGPDPKKFPDLRKDMQDNGWQPYSINISAAKRKALGESTAWQKGDQFTGPFSRVEPLGSLFGMAADYVEIMSNRKPDETIDEMAHHMVAATVKSMSSKTFIKGLSQTMLALTFPDEFLDKTLDRQAVSLVPVVGSSLSRKVTQQIDPIVRHAEGFIEELKKQTPGLSSSLPPELNRWGEEVYRQNAIGPDIASPFYSTTYKKDPVVEAIMKNKVNIPAAPDTLMGLPLSYEGKIELHQIIAKEVTKGGKTLHASMEKLLESSAFKKGSTGPDGRQALLLRSRVEEFTARGEMIMLKRHPELKQALKDHYKAQAQRMKSIPTVPDDRELHAADSDLPDFEIAGN